MITFTWKVRKLKCLDNLDNQQDVVKTVYWMCTASENGIDFDVAGSSPIEYNNESFTPFNSLTEEQVLEWCWNSNMKKSVIESTAEIGLQSKIVKASGLQNKDVPW